MRLFTVMLCAIGSVLANTATGDAQQIYWVQSTYGAAKIRTSDTTGNGVTTAALPAGSLPHGLAFHRTFASLFWTSGAYSNARVVRTTQALSGADTLPTGDQGSSFQGMALDTVAAKVYWVTSNIAQGCTIHRANLDGTGGEAIVTYAPHGPQNLRGIALDLQQQRMYWSDFGTGVIMRATLDGGAPETILTGLAGPVGVALDPFAGKVYWCEANGHAIRRANLNGTSPDTLVSGLPGAPHYLAIDPSRKRMYWTERGGSGRGWIKRATLDGAAVTTLLGEAAGDSVEYPSGIAVLWSGSVTGVEAARVPARFALAQNYPNPFNPTTTIAYEVPSAVHVRLGVYDILGRQVALLVDGIKDAGVYRVQFDAKGLASGVYVYRLQAGTFTQARGLVIAK